MKDPDSHVYSHNNRRNHDLRNVVQREVGEAKMSSSAKSSGSKQERNGDQKLDQTASQTSTETADQGIALSSNADAKNRTSRFERKLPEHITLERLLKSLEKYARVRVEGKVPCDGMEIPLYSLVLGTEDRTAPCLGIFGGVHGLERIGTDVVLSWLQTLAELLQWDETLHERLSRSRLVFMPLVNPGGMYLTRRSNPNGVDLMRNAPVEGDPERPPHPLLGGHTFSKHLPWYRGDASSAETMEIESKVMCDVVAREIFPSRLSLSVDVHSGFGSVDRIWFPYARTHRPPPHLAEIMALKRLMDRSYPNHFYCVEPQARQYTTHGDLWDWLYDRHPRESEDKGLYIPLALELGSWLWLRKNPRQLFSSLGAFNPILPHRRRRILRRHITLFDFLHRAILNGQTWTNLDAETTERLVRRARSAWYEGK